MLGIEPLVTLHKGISGYPQFAAQEIMTVKFNKIGIIWLTIFQSDAGSSIWSTRSSSFNSQVVFSVVWNCQLMTYTFNEHYGHQRCYCDSVR